MIHSSMCSLCLFGESLYSINRAGPRCNAYLTIPTRCGNFESVHADRICRRVAGRHAALPDISVKADARKRVQQQAKKAPAAGRPSQQPRLTAATRRPTAPPAAARGRSADPATDRAARHPGHMPTRTAPPASTIGRTASSPRRASPCRRRCGRSTSRLAAAAGTTRRPRPPGPPGQTRRLLVPRRLASEQCRRRP